MNEPKRKKTTIRRYLSTSLFRALASYEENEVLQIRPQIQGARKTEDIIGGFSFKCVYYNASDIRNSLVGGFTVAYFMPEYVFRGRRPGTNVIKTSKMYYKLECLSLAGFTSLV